MVEKSFKASNGKYYTRQLFWEEYIGLMQEQRVGQPIFSLYKDKPNMINFGKAYVESRDPTGYAVSQSLLEGDYTLWTVLMGCRWFVAAKEVWDRELDAAIASEAIQEIRDVMKTGMPSQRLAAAKYLANKEYRKDRTQAKGRPKREDIDRAAKDMAVNERELAEDLKRIKASGN